MKSQIIGFLLWNLFQLCSTFQLNGIRPTNHGIRFTQDSNTRLYAVSYDTVVDVGFGVSVQKPLGIVFGENPGPYYGLVVDDVSEGLNGGKAGLRVGDQLLAVNGNVVVGKDFDSIMGQLQAGPSRLDLIMYRGTVSSLFTILDNKAGGEQDVQEYLGDDDYDDGSEEVIMDESYESPVVIEVKEKKKLTPGDFFKAMQKVGTMLTEDEGAQSGEKKEKKKNTGFFGIGGDSIQLEGDDANTLK